MEKGIDKNAPIGIFDSGLGGLSVRREIVKRLPNESIIYFGDGKNCPYGPKDPHEVIAISAEITDILINQGVKLIVVACNAATAAAIDYLRANYTIPFVGMEPAVKPAVLHSRTGVIGILATAGTLKGKLFLQTSQRYSSNAEIISCVGEGFVEMVEQNMERSQECRKIVERCVNPMLDRNIDHLVLGCTHYPYLRSVIEDIIGDRNIEIVDPAPAIAARVENLLMENNMLADKNHIADYHFQTFADNDYLEKLIEKSKL